MEENKEQPKKCDGRCETCNLNQRTYCAAQIGYYNQQEIAAIKAVLATLTASNEQVIIAREKCGEIEDINVKSEPTASGADE